MPFLTGRIFTTAVVSGTLLVGSAFAQNAPAAPTIRLRGVVHAVTPASVSVKDPRGELVTLAVNDKLVVTEVYAIALSDIKPGSYIGAAAMPQADGTLKAIAVTVFTEAQRNVPQGHFPFYLQPQSTMTNAVVEGVVTAEGADAGRRMQLKYTGGEKTLDVPADATIVTSRPGDRSLLVVGASVGLFAQEIDGKPTALRISAGKNGFVLPY